MTVNEIKRGIIPIFSVRAINFFPDPLLAENNSLLTSKVISKITPRILRVLTKLIAEIVVTVTVDTII